MIKESLSEETVSLKRLDGVKKDGEVWAPGRETDRRWPAVGGLGGTVLGW